MRKKEPGGTHFGGLGQTALSGGRWEEELGVSGLRLGVGETLGAHSPLSPLGACWPSLLTSPDKHLYQVTKVNINSDKLA